MQDTLRACQLYRLTQMLMSDKFSKAVELAKANPANLEDTLVVKRPSQAEHRSRKVHTYLKPSEFDAFVRLIGRETLSNALRDLVLHFNNRSDEQEQ